VLLPIDCQSPGRLEPILYLNRHYPTARKFLACYTIHRLGHHSGNSPAVKQWHHSLVSRKSLQNMSLRHIHDYDDSHLPRLRIQS
jgi:hypothetical protein